MLAEGLSPPVPERAEIVRWLRQNIRKPAPSRIARWLGARADFSYEVSQPERHDLSFFRAHTIFRVSGERDLFPFPTLPAGSFGLLATNGSSITLLHPLDDSLQELFRAEQRPLNEAAPQSLAQFICDVRFSSRCARHAVLANAEALRTFPSRERSGYLLDSREWARVCNDIAPPAVQTRADGSSRLTFTSLFGWMHELQNLGTEQLDISRDFRIVRRDRRTLSDRIFSSVPHVRY
jgi:hypothetical protein